MNIQKFIFLCIFSTAVSPILLEFNRNPIQRCFYAQQSPDKAQFSLFQKVGQPCSIFLDITTIDDDDVYQQIIQTKQFTCDQIQDQHPFIVKHVPKDYKFNGRYKICLSVHQNYNQLMIIKLHFGQKFNPTYYASNDPAYPLVQASQLIDIQKNVQQIKVDLARIRKFTSHIQQKQMETQKKIKQVEELNKMFSLLQIAGMFIFGTIWTYLVVKLNKQIRL